jgi:pimeloyl-ACP methyl ester carboxylesterase
MRRILWLIALVALIGTGFAAAPTTALADNGSSKSNAASDDPWMSLPPTPNLPKNGQSGIAPVNGIKIWYSTWGPAGARPVLFLHGGLGNSDYFGKQISALEKKYRVIVMDSRGHGRSTRDGQPYSYDLMASDVIGLLDYLKIQRIAIVGWSDGAIIGLDIAIHHPERIAKLFAFAANSDPSGVADISKSKVFNDYINGTEKEYAALSPTPKDHKAFLDEIGKMWASQPNFTKQQLAGITTPTLIVDGDHDEAIKRENTEYMAATIPHAGLLILPRVGHFAFLQDPAQFNDALKHFLTHLPDAK